ncbi:MAG TPA: histidine triad nucleotide-binding protein [Armatimonadota bacterium]|mgnify:CR=1 FL=1|nr:histidine triad nucleotide-binding protein [Armatimonadota bacterium]
MEDCIFCKIARHEMGQLVYEDDQVAAFNDLNPAAPVHVLIIPKKHIEKLADIEDGEDACLAGHILTVANKIARERGIAEEGYRVVVNNGSGAGQSVWHLHFHLLGGRKLGWPPG